MILPAGLIGWLLSRWWARFAYTLDLAAALTIAVLGLQVAALLARDEGAHLSKSTKCHLIWRRYEFVGWAI
jgi:hypothetical protein